jgi:oligopeptide transport system ATP-binding protein
VNPPEGIMNRRATFSKMNLAPSDELKVMDTADKEPADLPHGKDPDIDSKIPEKGGLL